MVTKQVAKQTVAGQTEATSTPERSKRRAHKFEVRREELADVALATLAERGYAQTSLRDIAENSDFTHGVLHYYFHDKSELITYCVRRYKQRCVMRYEGAVLPSATVEDLRRTFADAMVSTLIDDAHMQRLWYDLRSQAMFERSLAADVAELDAGIGDLMLRIVTRYAALSQRRLVVEPELLYALLDGLFQHTLIRQLRGDEPAADLRRGLDFLLDTVTSPASG